MIRPTPTPDLASPSGPFDLLAQRLNRFLHWQRLRTYGTILLVAQLLIYLFYILGGTPPFTAAGIVYGSDYLAHLNGGWLAWHGDWQALYDPQAQHAAQDIVLGIKQPNHLSLFISPPFAALFYAPLTQLPYIVSVVLWLCFSLLLLAVSLRLVWPLLPALHPWGMGRVALIFMSSMPVFELLGIGQNTALSIFLFALGFRLLHERRDVAAGLVLAFLLHKPQLAVLVPFLLLFEGRASALLSWLGMAALLTGFSLWLVGSSGVGAYLGLLRSDFYRIGIIGEMTWKMISLPALLRYLGLAVLIYPLLPLLLGLGLWGMWQTTSFKRRAALMMLLTITLSPHLFVYDGALLLLPLLLLLDWRRDDPLLHALIVVLYVLLWMTPFGFAPLVALVLLALCVYGTRAGAPHIVAPA